MKSIQRILSLIIFLFFSTGFVSSSYSFFNKKNDKQKQSESSSVKPNDIFTDSEILKGFLTELSVLKKDQLEPSFKEIAATEKESLKLEITLTIGPALGKILDKYLNYQEGTKVQIKLENKKFPQGYTKNEINEAFIKSKIIKFIVIVLETELFHDQLNLTKDKFKWQLQLLKEFLKIEELLFYHIKTSIVGVIPESVPQFFDPQTLIHHIFLRNREAKNWVQKDNDPQNLLEDLKTLISNDRFKLELPETWIGDKDQKVTFKITYLGGSGSDSQSGTNFQFESDPQVELQTKITCLPNEYYFKNQCISESDCNTKAPNIYPYTDKHQVKQCGLCPVDQADGIKGTHKLVNGVCVKKAIEEKYSPEFIQIMESFGREATKQYEPKIKPKKEEITLNIYHPSLFGKYFYQTNEKQTIVLDNGKEVTVPSDYTENHIWRYLEKKVLEFLEKYLDNNLDTIKLINKNRLLSEFLNLQATIHPNKFNPNNNLWQYIYLNEVSSFIGENGTQITKPSSYIKVEMIPYLKKLLKETNKWQVINFFDITYKTDRKKCINNSYFHNNQCISKEECQKKNLITYTDKHQVKQCGLCPATHNMVNNECLPLATQNANQNTDIVDSKKMILIPAFKDLNLLDSQAVDIKFDSWDELKGIAAVSECPEMKTIKDQEEVRKFKLTFTPKDKLSIDNSNKLLKITGYELNVAHCLPQSADDMESVFPGYNQLSDQKKLQYEEAFLKRKNKILRLIISHVITTRSLYKGKKQEELQELSNSGDTVEGVLYPILNGKKLAIRAKVKMSVEEIRKELEKRLGSNFPKINQEARNLYNKDAGYKYFLLVVDEVVPTIFYLKETQESPKGTYPPIIYKKDNIVDLSKNMIDNLTLESLTLSSFFDNEESYVNSLPKAESLDQVKYRGVAFASTNIKLHNKLIENPNYIISMLNLGNNLNQALDGETAIYKYKKDDIKYDDRLKMKYNENSTDNLYNLMAITKFIKEFLNFEGNIFENFENRAILYTDAEKNQENLRDKVIVDLKHIGNNKLGIDIFYLYLGQTKE